MAQFQGGEGMAMKENGLGGLFIRHLVMAIPWGIILLVVFAIVAMGVKQQVKEGIQYTMQEAIIQGAGFAYDYQVVTTVKKNIKEGIEFLAKTARSELKAIVNDPQVKQDIKEAFEYGGDKMRHEIRLLLNDPRIKQDIKEALEYSGQTFH